MKAAWESTQLGEVAELQGRIGWRGLTAKEYTEKGPLFLSVHALNHGDYVDFRRAFHISEERYSESPEIMLRPHDILICKDGAGIGKVGIVGALPDRATINSSLLLIRPSDRIAPKYLYRYLCSPQFQKLATSQLNGATTPHLYQRDIAEFPVPIPPPSEQQRIIGVLDKALATFTAAKANAQKNLRNARALFESRLTSIFAPNGNGWRYQRLEDVTAKIGSGATPLGGERVYEASGVPLIRSLNVHDSGFRHKGLVFLNESQAVQLQNVSVRANDVLLNITGGSIARCCVAPSTLVPARVSQHVSIVRPVPTKLDSDFLHYLLISMPYKDRLLRTGESGGSTRQAITKAQIEDFLIAAPEDIDEQRALASSLGKLESATSRLADTYEQKLAAIEELKKALLQEAFRGHL